MDSRINFMPCGFISLNLEYQILEVNDTFLKWTQYNSDELKGKHIEDLLPPGNKLIFHSYFYPCMTMHEQVDELYIHFFNKDGESIPFIMNAKRYEGNGKYFIDITLVQMKKRIDYERELRHTKVLLEDAYAEKNRAFEQLQQIYNEIEKKQFQLLAIHNELVEISNTDKLTGIANRRFFQMQLEAHMEQYKLKEIPFSLLIIDIDHFKQVNDTYGHHVGDIVLTHLAIILKEYARPTDTVARFGGEEFTILLGNTNEKKALRIAQQYNELIAQYNWPTINHLTVSIGCATFNDLENEETILQHADEALYQSKRNGRNQATLYKV